MPKKLRLKLRHDRLPPTWRKAEEMSGLLKLMQAQGARTVSVPLAFITATGSLTEALVLSELAMRLADESHPARCIIDRGDVSMVAASVEELAADLGLKPRSVRTALTALRKAGLLRIEQHHQGGRKVGHYRVAVPELACRIYPRLARHCGNHCRGKEGGASRPLPGLGRALRRGPDPQSL